jgi:hypothetical protein
MMSPIAQPGKHAVLAGLAPVNAFCASLYDKKCENPLCAPSVRVMLGWLAEEDHQ